jgi:competence protein ComEC
MSEQSSGYRFFILLFLFLLVANLAVWREVYFLHQQKLKISFFDVGQGDSILIETPERHFILIDGGPDHTVLEKIGESLPFYQRKIDLIVLTHPHADHLHGLVSALERYQVDQVLWTGVDCSTSLCRRWESLLADHDQVFIALAGQRIKSKSVFIDVLYPLQSINRYLLSDQNDGSIVLKLNYGRHGFLFTGDALPSNENELMAAWQDYLKSNVLKVAHHGSRFSSQEDFLDMVDPELAVVQVGEGNRYGHPAPEVLERLLVRGIDLRRTDQDGDIKIISDGLNYYEQRRKNVSFN